MNGKTGVSRVRKTIFQPSAATARSTAAKDGLVVSQRVTRSRARRRATRKASARPTVAPSQTAAAPAANPKAPPAIRVSADPGTANTVATA